MSWRVNRKKVYEGKRLVCECLTVKDARRIVDAINEDGRRFKQLFQASRLIRHAIEVHCEELIKDLPLFIKAADPSAGVNKKKKAEGQ